MEKGMKNVPKQVVVGFAIQSVIFVIGIILSVFMARVAVIEEQDTSEVNQILEDWGTVPFVSVQTTKSLACPAGTESIFVREWGGTETGCLVHKKNTFELDTTQTTIDLGTTPTVMS